MWPRYWKLVRFLREKGVSVLIMDCDGHIGELIPFWLDVGITTVSPIEIAAGNDPVTYRKRYGKNLGMLGGIDKRELRFDKTQVRAEVLSKVPWLVEQGGYIPSVDHGVPPDIPVRPAKDLSADRTWPLSSSDPNGQDYPPVRVLRGRLLFFPLLWTAGVFVPGGRWSSRCPIVAGSVIPRRFDIRPGI